MATQGVAQTRPVARGGAQAQDEPLVRPQERPELRPSLQHGAQTLPIYRAEEGVFARSPYAVIVSLRPQERPAAIETAAIAASAARVRGQVCGDPNIQGEARGRITGRGGCGIESAVRVTSVAGVRLTSRPTMDCTTAIALKDWVENGAKPAVGGEGGGIAALRTVSDYACRNRNNASSGKLSEHATGRAIDIAGIKLNSGREITILRGWGAGNDGRRLRKMWQAACGPFGTVLGPEANRFHRDHFHFDTARYRSGPYCR